MKADILIRGGRVIDPHANLDAVCDVALKGDRVVDAASVDGAGEVVDAAGCLVLPGLVDYHTHIYHGGSDYGLKPDYLLATGVTATVDAGSSGASNYEAFRSRVIDHSSVKIQSLISVNSIGLAVKGIHQDYSPELINRDRIHLLRERYGDEILGLKIMYTKGLVADGDEGPIRAALELAGEMPGTRLVVHTTDSAIPVARTLELLRPGDVFCHCYQGTGETIMDGSGKVLDCVRQARERGVIFDCAHGESHFSNELARSAIAQGFLPDVITTDLTLFSIHKGRRSRNMPLMMSLFLELGMELADVVRAVSATPAALMNRAGRIDTLTPGAAADVAILREVKAETEFEDTLGHRQRAERILVPMMTVCDGEIAFCNGGFAL